MHIGIDFDDTLMNTRKSMVDLLNQIHKEQIEFDNVHIYEISDLYGYNFEQFHEFFTSKQFELNNIEPEGNLIEIIDRISRKAKLSLITARPTGWMSSAIEWIYKHKLPISNFNCASEYEDGKAECAEKLGVTIFIEDHPKHALKIANQGIEVLLINKPYNQECKHDNIRRVSGWEEIEQILSR
jgi:uncharacterized protein